MGRWGDGEMGSYISNWCSNLSLSLLLPIYHSLFPIPDSRFPIPDSRFPIPCSRFPVP
ncbi:hypothetical protein [Moorena sp. SIO3H5]|uniref:hypothetical protein n=1 Tax=Moorena sp. SIO3H5 TaxID=2607834 RepID=UPI0013BD6285|nr:hypothetical protein [Moorena sp. SIO3H5]NEO72427.1 hypothetical protein [Moorena sp. SIO3H5]